MHAIAFSGVRLGFIDADAPKLLQTLHARVQADDWLIAPATTHVSHDALTAVSAWLAAPSTARIGRRAPLLSVVVGTGKGGLSCFGHNPTGRPCAANTPGRLSNHWGYSSRALLPNLAGTSTRRRI